MKFMTILPVNPEEERQYKCNPKQWIESKLETIHPYNPLLKAVFDSVIQNDLTDTEFYLFLSYYAMDRVLRLEQELVSYQSIQPRVDVTAPKRKERIKL